MCWSPLPGPSEAGLRASRGSGTASSSRPPSAEKRSRDCVVVDCSRRLAIRLLLSLVAGGRQVDLRIELHTQGIVMQLPHPSEFPYRPRWRYSSSTSPHFTSWICPSALESR